MAKLQRGTMEQRQRLVDVDYGLWLPKAKRDVPTSLDIPAEQQAQWGEDFTMEEVPLKQLLERPPPKGEPRLAQA